MQPSLDELQRIIVTALQEDIGHGDITSASVIPDHSEVTLQFTTREDIIVSGIGVAGLVFEAVDPNLDFMARIEDGERAQAGKLIASVMGNAQAILAGERVALNLLQRMCGIATETAKYVNSIKDSNCKILDTRKTMPGLRAIDKYAVTCGGGYNHRMRLDDMVMIKDNHISIVGSIGEAVASAKANAPATTRIEVECDTLEQVSEALQAGADMLLLDNMTLDETRQAVILAKGKAQCEASGGMTLERVAEVADTGVDFISVGALTHSARAADIGLDEVQS